jgi:hypothetical protein
VFFSLDIGLNCYFDIFLTIFVGTEKISALSPVGNFTLPSDRVRYNKSVNEGKPNKVSKFNCALTKAPVVFNAKDVVTFRVYSDGRIEKHIPKVIKEGFESKYKYVYHDKDKGEHDIATVDFFNDVQNWSKGSKKDGGKGWEKRTAEGKIRYYKKAEGTNELVKMPLPLNYSSKNVIIKFADNTTRGYMDPRAFASIIGALGECNYSDVTMNGFTSEDGTGAPSVSHVNGLAGDFRYLRKDKSGAALYIDKNPEDLDIVRQEKMIDAFVKFGYSSFLSFNITIDKKPFILKKCSHLEDHHHHIHLNKLSYSPDFTEVKEK